MKILIKKYLDLRIVSLLSILILFLPFVNILETEIKTESIGEKYADTFIYKSFTGFELFKEALHTNENLFAATLLLLFFIIIVLQFLLSLFKKPRIILILSIILILMTLGFCILVKSVDSSSTILIGCYLFGINQLLIYYRT